MDFMAFGGVWLLFSFALQVAVLVLVVLGIVWLVRRLAPDAPRSHGTPSAIDELELRYARGEVDRTTYLQILEDLKKHASG